AAVGGPGAGGAGGPPPLGRGVGVAQQPVVEGGPADEPLGGAVAEQGRPVEHLARALRQAVQRDRGGGRRVRGEACPARPEDARQQPPPTHANLTATHGAPRGRLEGRTRSTLSLLIESWPAFHEGFCRK